MGSTIEFELSEGIPADLDEIIHVLVTAIASDEIFRYTNSEVTPEDSYKFFHAFFATRYAMDDISYFKITEKASGKIAAFTALQYPWSIRPLTDEEKAEENALDPLNVPPTPKGWKMDGWIELFGMLTGTHHYGYDPEKDFHRCGTMVLPEFQRRGFAKSLTQHCNAISDQYECKTYVPARFTSVKMFRDSGFKDVGIFDPHAERWGDEYDVEKAKYFLLCRDPQLVE